MKICVAGQGAFGQKHLDALKRIPGVEISSLVGGNQDSTAQVAKKYGIPHYTGELSEGIKRADAVILTTPTQMHAAQAMQVKAMRRTGTNRRSSSVLGMWRPMLARNSCQSGPATAKTPSRAERARDIRSPFHGLPASSRRGVPHLRIASIIGIDDVSVCLGKNCGKAVNDPLTVQSTPKLERLGFQID
jgi:hypothetical protein